MTRAAAFLRRPILVLIAVAVLWPDAALAWGGQGHRIVARLAMRQLRREAATNADAKRAKDMVYDAVEGNGTTVEAAALFPDVVRETEDWRYTKNWHFVSIPRSETSYEAATRCVTTQKAPEGDCAIGGLAHFRQIVLDERGAATQATLDALSFIIHIIGDLHQPLHTSEDLSFIHDGQPGDRGGNYRRVCFFGGYRSSCTEVWDGKRKPKNLHATWDKYMIIRTGKSEDETVYVNELDEEIRGLDDTELAAYLQGGPVQWAEEAHALAVDAAYSAPLLKDTTVPQSSKYGDYFYIGSTYYKANIESVDAQLVKAAVRLAAYLKQIAHELPATP